MKQSPEARFRGRPAAFRWAPGAFKSVVCWIGLIAGIGGTTVPAQSASLFADTDRPQVESVRDTRAVEVGVRFTASEPGVITGIRFYKGPRNRGTHIGSLWSETGKRLASGVFQNGSDSGWQTLNFLTPVPIKPDTIYVASYWSANGGHSYDRNYFKFDRRNGPLTAPAGHRNGVLRYGSSGFPDSTQQRSNYWVDVLFEPVNSGPPSPAPTPPPTSGTVPDGYVLAWSDEFDSLSLGTASDHRWAPMYVGWNVRHLAGNNDEAAKFADDEILRSGAHKAGDLLRQTGLWGSRSGYLHEVSGGQLALRGYPIIDSHRYDFWGFPYVASMISGQNSFSQRYGYWETRVLMTNVSKGHHFAIWLLPDDNSWPPEIDLLEVVGQYQDRIFTNSHGSGREISSHSVQSISRDWYTVGFLWTPTIMRWTINGQVVREHPNYINSKDLYMLMLWDIGSNWPSKTDSSTKWPAEVLIDYVRIYQPATTN